MSLDRIGPCVACGVECEGWVCSFACETALRNAEQVEREAHAEDYGDGTPRPCWNCGEQLSRMPTRWNEIARAAQRDGPPDAWRCADCWRCEQCGDTDPEPAAEPAYDQRRLCDNCWSNEAEAAHERSLEDYYGGSTPQTLEEQARKAWEQKRGRA